MSPRHPTAVHTIRIRSFVRVVHERECLMLIPQYAGGAGAVRCVHTLDHYRAPQCHRNQFDSACASVPPEHVDVQAPEGGSVNMMMDRGLVVGSSVLSGCMHMVDLIMQISINRNGGPHV